MAFYNYFLSVLLLAGLFEGFAFHNLLHNADYVAKNRGVDWDMKRIISLLLTLSMVFSLFSGMSFQVSASDNGNVYFGRKAHPSRLISPPFTGKQPTCLGSLPIYFVVLL